VARKLNWLPACLGVCALLVLAAPPQAHASWRGANGSLVFVANDDVDSAPPPGRGRTVRYRLITTRPDGSHARVIFECENVRATGCQLLDGVSWSPDGQQIAFSLNGALAVINADGSGLRRLPRQSDYDRSPVWSPDGRQLAFIGLRRQPHASDLYIVRADGTSMRQLTAGADAHELAWSPRGRIAYTDVTWRSTKAPYKFGAIYLVDTRGRSARRVLAGGQPRQLDWSASGNRLLFTRDSYPHAVRQAGLWTLGADGTGRHALLENGYGGLFSPDGRQLVYYRNGALYRSRVDGKRPRPIDFRTPREWNADLESWQARTHR
jgi:Tol biopolymer transport system component